MNACVALVLGVAFVSGGWCLRAAPILHSVKCNDSPIFHSEMTLSNFALCNDLVQFCTLVMTVQFGID